MQYYALLQRRASTDAELAKALQPISQFFAYRHPSTKHPVGSPTKKQVRAAKKAQKTLDTVAGGRLAPGAAPAPAPEPTPAPAPAASPVTNGTVPTPSHS
jgi:hypothetical protein